MEKKDFIRDCERVVEIMENSRSQSSAITQRLVDTYKLTLEDLQKHIDKFAKIMAKKTGNQEIKRRPLSVTLYHTLFSIGFGAIFGSLAGVGASVLLGGFNPALWSPFLIGIGSILGVITLTPTFIAKQVRLTKDYRNGKFDNKKRSLTKLLNDRSLKKHKLTTLATANEYSEITEERISQYLSKLLSSNGLGKNNLDFLSPSKKRKISKLIDKINDCKDGLTQTHQLLLKEKIINDNLKIYDADDELKVSTQAKPKTRTPSERKVSPIQKSPSRVHAQSSEEMEKNQTHPRRPRPRPSNDGTTHRQHKPKL